VRRDTGSKPAASIATTVNQVSAATMPARSTARRPPVSAASAGTNASHITRATTSRRSKARDSPIRAAKLRARSVPDRKGNGCQSQQRQQAGITNPARARSSAPSGRPITVKKAQAQSGANPGFARLHQRIAAALHLGV